MKLALFICAFAFALLPARAQDFRVAMSSPANSMDPHWHNVFGNINVSEHIFEALVKLDADSRVVPGLAEKWRLVDANTWEFTLRDGVHFHDGAPLTVEDVFFSLDRPASIVNSPGSFAIYTRQITGKDKVDARTFRLRTSSPYPLMLNDLTSIYIVEKKAVQAASPEEFGSGLKAVIGTGPYRFVRFARDDRVELGRNPLYWGTRPPYQNVTLRFIANGAARLAALMSNDVQAIENVPTPDLDRVRSDPSLSFFSKVSHRVIYFNLDQRETTPFVTAKDGKPLPANPLRDLRVRQALNLAINRQAIADRVMSGLALPTMNLVPATLFGHNPKLAVPKPDAERAKKLLAEAGYPDGFAMTLHGPNNRYINDAQIVQAVAGMFQRIGIDTKVETMPLATYFPRGNKLEFSMPLVGWGAQTGEASSPLRAIIASRDESRGMGTVNWGSYSNAQFDAVLAEALRTVDDTKRSALLQQATQIAIDDLALLPLHHQLTTWAARKGIDYLPRTDERTYAFGFRPAQ
ncbi:ABC transporter substrate-binding protein [Derxia lacustris]|uniref:ABC transporter substrate-binding protein n=1 Tax=Derxia lacustris TaxID=764842 RepID=UPI001F175291|nr:ABC transporter substrate-binding protein [Derxia lacustris]